MNPDGSEVHGMGVQRLEGNHARRAPDGRGSLRQGRGWGGVVCIAQDSPTPLEFQDFSFSPSSSLGVTSPPSNQSRGLGKK